MWAKKANRKQVNRNTGKHVRIKLPVYLFTFFLVYFITGCVTLPDPESTQDFSSHQVATVTAEQSVGQTFISRRPRLNGIDLWLQPVESTLLKIELFRSPDNVDPVFSGYVRASEGRNHIAIPARDVPRDQTYYLRISADQGKVTILGRNEDAYPQGTAFVNNQPIAADLAFRATYEYETQAAFEDFRGLLSIWEVLLALGILLFLPGWLLLDFSGWKNKFDAGERLGLSLGLSLAVIPVLMLWTSLIGLRWGRISLWLVIAILLAVLVWRWFRGSQPAGHKPQATDTDDRPLTSGDAPSANHVADERLDPSSHNLLSGIIPHSAFVLLIAIFALALFLRFAMVRDLAAPAWVDSIHHALISRLMIENGGLPVTYAPYLPQGADHYHFGYHSTLAAFIWLTGLEIPQAMLIFGQVLNALMVYPIYLLTKTLTRNQPASLAAALIASTFTLMPAYYASWGRYTQLTGLLVLPAAFVMLVKILKSRSRSELPKQAWLIAALTLAGLFLIHYRVMAFLGALVLAYLLVQVNPKEWLPALGKLMLLGLFCGLLLLPWLPETFSDLFLPTGIKLSGGNGDFSTIPWNFLKPGLGVTALVLAAIGLVLGLILQRRFTITVILWTAFIYLLANMSVFAHFPGAGFINPVSMEITLFMPIAVLGGFAIGGTLELLDKVIRGNWQIVPRVIIVALGAWAGLLGAQRLLPTLNPSTFLARAADFAAIHWIEENIPKGETILINPALWGYGLYMGNDGGFWISALSDHPTIPPPVIYGLGERSEVEKINQIAEAVRTDGENPAALWDLMQAENIQFVYTGGRGGVISPQALAQSELFTVRYQQNGTWVFEALQPNP